MPRRKSNLGRRTRHTEGSRRRLSNMTEEERASVRERNRLSTIQTRNVEPAERRAARLEDARLRGRQSRSAATNLVRSERNERERVRIAETRTERTADLHLEYSRLAFGVNTSLNQVMEDMDKTNKTQPQEQVECRACLQKFEYDAGLLDIFQPWDPPWHGMGDSIAQDMAQITNIDITPTDEFSKLICQFCYQKLLEACSFVMNVRINDKLLRQRVETLHDHETIWPKPLQVNRHINSDVLNTLMDVPMKREVSSNDESYANGADDGYKEGVEDDGTDTCSNLGIKIDPEVIMQPPPIQITVNGTITQDQFEQNSIVMNGDHKPPELEPEPEPEPEPTLEPEKVEIKVEPKSEEDEVEIPPDLSLECMLCTKSFNSVTGLKAHVIAQHSYKTVKRKLDGQPSPERKRAKHVCVTCRRSFTTPTDLMVHETCHNKLSCYGCNHKCDTFEQLTKHRKKCKALKNNTHTRPKTLDDVKRPHIEPPLLVEAFSRPVDLPETQKDSDVKMHFKIQSLCEEMDADAPADQMDNNISEDKVKP